MDVAYLRMEVKMVSRGDGASIVAKAAYRNGLAMYDERTGSFHDYPRKGRIDHNEIRAPQGAPAWALDPNQLNNAIEANEIRRDAQLARDILVCVTHALDFDGGLAAIREFADHEFTRHGYIAQISSHGYEPDLNTGRRSWHFHLITSERPLIDGEWAKVKDRRRNSFRQLFRWRRRMALAINKALRAAGKLLRVQYLSAERRGVEAKPTHQPYWLWKRAQAAADTARDAALRSGVEQALALSSEARPVLDGKRNATIDAPPFSDVLSVVQRKLRSIVDASAELAMSAVDRVQLHLEEKEKTKREKAAQQADEERLHAEWFEKDRVSRRNRAREDLLSIRRDELFRKASGREPRLAYAKAWGDAADGAFLLEAKMVDRYGPDADRIALRELIRAGGTDADIDAMVWISPYAQLLTDLKTRMAHCQSVIATVVNEPGIAKVLDKNERASVRAYQEATAARYVPHYQLDRALAGSIAERHHLIGRAGLKASIVYRIVRQNIKLSAPRRRLSQPIDCSAKDSVTRTGLAHGGRFLSDTIAPPLRLLRDG